MNTKSRMISFKAPVDLVVPRNTLLHDVQQVRVGVPAVDQDGFLHGDGQTQLTLKHLQRGAADSELQLFLLSSGRQRPRIG